MFLLHGDLWQSIFDVWTSDKQVGGALQTHVYCRMPKYKALCALKVAKMICKCKWQTHQFHAKVILEGRDSLRDLGQGQDAEHDQGWTVSMSGIPLPRITESQMMAVRNVSIHTVVSKIEKDMKQSMDKLTERIADGTEQQ